MSSLDPTLAGRWRGVRRPLLVLLLVLATASVMAVLTRTTDSARLDPRAPNPDGARALAQLLGDQGVDVELRTTTARVLTSVGSGAGTTLLVNDPELLVDEQVASVTATGADLVVIAPERPQRFLPGARVEEVLPLEARDPGCGLAAARRAGSAQSGGFAFAVEDTPAMTCYGSGAASPVVSVERAGRVITLLGSSVPLTNRHLDDEGNAALALGLLGADERLVWYLPSLSDVPASSQRASFLDLVPAGIWWAVAQLAVAALVLVWWRARRLGPVVTEPLPVVVRAAETSEGRARLYRRAGARDTAAEALRSSARTRLTASLGVPGRSAPAAVVDAVATRTSRQAVEVGSLLYGAAPADDSALVRLANELDLLEEEVRRP